MPKTIKKIILTGGHLSPALAILPELLRQNYQVIFVGRKSALSNRSDLSLEYRLLSKNPQIKFYSLSTGRFTRGFWITLPIELFKSLYGFVRAIEIVILEKPDCVMSFGGYLALPICLAAAIFRCPVYLHEQTIAPGKANRLLARLATKVGVALPESLPYFPPHKSRLVGIAIKSQREYPPEAPPWYSGQKPCLLITGGSTGAHCINQKIAPLLPKLVQSFSVVHQTGDSQYRDFEHLEKQNLPNYFPRKYLWPSEMSYFLYESSLIVSRAGANTFFEIIKYKKPAVLIPLSLAANNEQFKQARVLEKAGVARIVLESDSSLKLDKQIALVFAQKKETKENFQNLAEYAKLIVNEKQFLKQFGL
jgi:UDP-N-acetylglucosamine--N-acetylmuramyl-(pentapeptide) pyrophosphoryl-undecaprenol N-acetylglucosamine transferase